jgi:CheY-like chemotaxis protein
MKLLVVDDEPHIRHMMRLTLEGGYHVEEAANGEAALARFGDGREYDLVVLDQKMPGMDGLETLRRIKDRSPEARVLIVTAFASVELAVDAMKLGATDFLRKPMTPEVLRGAVAAALSTGVGSRLQLLQAGPVESVDAKTANDSRPHVTHVTPDIQILTLNGFQIIPPAEPRDRSTTQHSFRVKHVKDGSEVTVTVTINPDAVSRVERLTRRRLEPGGAFWRALAQRLLSSYLWIESKTPPAGALTVEDVSREDLDLAADWKAG